MHVARHARWLALIYKQLISERGDDKRLKPIFITILFYKLRAIFNGLFNYENRYNNKNQ